MPDESGQASYRPIKMMHICLVDMVIAIYSGCKNIVAEAVPFLLRSKQGTLWALFALALQAPAEQPVKNKLVI